MFDIKYDVKTDCAAKGGHYKPLKQSMQKRKSDNLFYNHLLCVFFVLRYCKTFPNDGLSFPLPRCRVKVMEKDHQIHVVSRLYLPRHSQVFWPFKVSPLISHDALV
jgi:hypothetical protein